MICLGFSKICLSYFRLEFFSKCKKSLNTCISSRFSELGNYHEYKNFQGTAEMTNSLLVMEYVGHYNLMAVIQSQPGKLTQPFIVKACIQLSQALDHCHKRGVYHLDVKPANVLVIKDRGSPVFKLADFGCSTTETRLDQVVGTPGYQV